MRAQLEVWVLFHPVCPASPRALNEGPESKSRGSWKNPDSDGKEQNGVCGMHRSMDTQGLNIQSLHVLLVKEDGEVCFYLLNII